MLCHIQLAVRNDEELNKLLGGRWPSSVVWCLRDCGPKTRRVVIVAGHHSLAVTRERAAGDFIGVTRQRGVELTPAAAFADRMVGSPPPSRLQAESWWLYLLLFIFACHVSSFLALPCLHLQDMQYKKIAVCIIPTYR